MRLKRRHVILAALAAAFLFGLGLAGAVETSYTGEAITWDVTPARRAVTAPPPAGKSLHTSTVDPPTSANTRASTPSSGNP
jgi:hypothetical protein